MDSRKVRHMKMPPAELTEQVSEEVLQIKLSHDLFGLDTVWV